MGGVDLLDQLISYYRSFIKSKKWTLRIISHFFDFAVCAAWIEYKKDMELNNKNKNRVINLLNFRLYIANYLLKTSEDAIQKRNEAVLTMKIH